MSSKFPLNVRLYVRFSKCPPPVCEWLRFPTPCVAMSMVELVLLCEMVEIY